MMKSGLFIVGAAGLAAWRVEAVLSDACQIALGADRFLDGFKNSKVAGHFDRANEKCNADKSKAIDAFHKGTSTDASIACGCRRDYLQRACSRAAGSMYIVSSTNRIGTDPLKPLELSASTLKLHAVACMPTECTRADIHEFFLERDEERWAKVKHTAFHWSPYCSNVNVATGMRATTKAACTASAMEDSGSAFRCFSRGRPYVPPLPPHPPTLHMNLRALTSRTRLPRASFVEQRLRRSGSTRVRWR